MRFAVSSVSEIAVCLIEIMPTHADPVINEVLEYSDGEDHE